MIALLSYAVFLPNAVFADDFSQAIKSAYETNPRLKAQRKLLETSDERVSEARSGWLPSINAGYDNGRQRTRSGGGDWTINDSESKNITISQPIFRGGATIYGTARAKEEMYASRQDLLSQEQAVLFDAITAYMNVVRDQAIVELSDNNEAVLRQQLQASQDRFDVGEVTKTDVAQSSSRLARATTDKVQAEGNLISSQANFERVIGYRPEGYLDPPQNFPALPNSLENAIEVAYAKSPAINSSKHRQLSAEESVNASISTLLPQVSINGTVSRQDGVGFSGASDFDSDSVTLNVAVPLYQSGAEYSRVRQAKIRASQLKYSLDNQRDAAKEAVIQSWQVLRTSIATIYSTDEDINAAEIALDGVKQEQIYGSRTVLDVLDAEQELFSARVRLVSAQYDRILAIYDVLSSVGSLTVNNLGVDVKKYDPTSHYEDVKYQFIGF